MKTLFFILITVAAGAVQAQTTTLAPDFDADIVPTGDLDTNISTDISTDTDDSDCTVLPEEYQADCYAALNKGDYRPRPYPSKKPRWSTSTIYVTNTVTISSCHSSVTNCPYTSKPLTTVTILTSTTVCPFTSSSTSSSTSTSKCKWPYTCTTSTTSSSSTSCPWGETCTTTTTICSDSSTSTSSSSTTSSTDKYPGTTTTKTESCTHNNCHKTTTTYGPSSTYTQAGGALREREVMAGAWGVLAGFAAVLL